jgi:hypothetical protein
MKTIKQHLESISDPELREAALRNMNCDEEDIREDVVASMFSAFIWADAKEGHNFWSAIVDFYEYGGEPTYQKFKHLIQ